MPLNRASLDHLIHSSVLDEALLTGSGAVMSCTCLAITAESVGGVILSAGLIAEDSRTWLTAHGAHTAETDGTSGHSR